MEWLKDWISNVAFYYLFMTVISNTLPEGKEKKYVQFYLGLLITLFLLRPILHLGKLEITLERNVIDNITEEYFQQMQRETKQIDVIGEDYLIQAYKIEIEKQMIQWLDTHGYETMYCDIGLHISGKVELENIRLRIRNKQENNQSENEQKEFLKKEFMEVYNIPQGNINISIQG